MSAGREGEGKEWGAYPNSCDSKRKTSLTLNESSPSCDYLVEGSVYVRTHRVFFLEVMSSSSQKTTKKEGEGELLKS